MLALYLTSYDTSSMTLNINIHLKKERPGSLGTGANCMRSFTQRRVLTLIRLYMWIAA